MGFNYYKSADNPLGEPYTATKLFGAQMIILAALRLKSIRASLMLYHIYLLETASKLAKEVKIRPTTMSELFLMKRKGQ